MKYQAWLLLLKDIFSCSWHGGVLACNVCLMMTLGSDAVIVEENEERMLREELNSFRRSGDPYLLPFGDYGISSPASRGNTQK